jgi:hypothetical protein
MEVQVKASPSKQRTTKYLRTFANYRPGRQTMDA